MGVQVREWGWGWAYIVGSRDRGNAGNGVSETTDYADVGVAFADIVAIWTISLVWRDRSLHSVL